MIINQNNFLEIRMHEIAIELHVTDNQWYDPMHLHESFERILDAVQQYHKTLISLHKLHVIVADEAHHFPRLSPYSKQLHILLGQLLFETDKSLRKKLTESRMVRLNKFYEAVKDISKH